jgi:hypothetical protein
MPEVYYQPQPDITRLFDTIQSYVPTVTTDMVAMAIWGAIEEFYIKSTYRRDYVSWSMAPGIAMVDLDPQGTWRVCRFMEFEGLSRVRFQPPGKIYDLTIPVPTTTRSGHALLALKPNDFNTVLPYDIYSTYWDTLLQGALFRLHMQPGKPYSDLQIAQGYGRLFRSGVATARAEAQAGHLRDAQAWSFPYYANGGHASGSTR